MQEFFMDYGLWLLVGLLIIIALVFLLSGKRKSQDAVEPHPLAEPVAPPASPSAPPSAPPSASTPFVDPIIAAPVAPAPLVVDPVVVEPVAPVEPPAPAEPAAPAEPVVQPAPEPTRLAQPTAAAPTEDAADDLLRLKGVGPKLKLLLIELGVTRYAQIAAWTDGDIAAIDAKLGNFRGRPVRDQWVDQASYLAAGDIVGFEAKYGRL